MAMFMGVTFADVWSVVTAFYVVAIIVVIAFIIYEKREPEKALAWITVIALLPVVGVFLYFIFGRNRRKEKIFNRKELHDLEQLDRMCLRQLTDISNPDLLHHRSVADNRDIITLLLNSNKAPLTMHNRLKVLHNGKETFSDLLDSLRRAEKFIHMEYYIFENDRVGRKVARILMDKARSGVAVRLIYDDVGSWGLSPRFVYKLRKAGVETGKFMPVVFPWLTSGVNYRNHRKIVVVDGKRAYTGGINIAERYLRGTRLGRWRDTHLRIEGDAVGMLQAIFVTDWYFVSGKRLFDTALYFPPAKVDAVTPMQIASSGPDSDWASIMQAFFAAIGKARRYIYICSPYFLPNQAVLTAMKVAALSGIDVRVIIPSRSDSKVVYWATRSYIPELLEAGIKVFLYRKGFIHAKVIIIDGEFCSVGTANMDIRSFEDNFEVSAIIYDRATARILEEQFREDMADSVEITAEMWDRRSSLHAAYEALARLLSPLL